MAMSIQPVAIQGITLYVVSLTHPCAPLPASSDRGYDPAVRSVFASLVLPPGLVGQCFKAQQ